MIKIFLSNKVLDFDYNFLIYFLGDSGEDNDKQNNNSSLSSSSFTTTNFMKQQQFITYDDFK